MCPQWILEDNLQLFLTLVARFIGYAMDDSDWDAVRFGVGESDVRANIWYEYSLIGNSQILLWVARAEGMNWVLFVGNAIGRSI